MNEADVDVLVVGAGPTGLALGIELRRWGANARVVDRLPQPPRITKATGVMPRTLEVLDAVGARAPLFEAGLALRGMTTWTDGDRELMALSFDGIDSPYPLVVSLPQYETERVLMERLRALGGTVERGVNVVAVEPTDGRVDVRCEIDGRVEHSTARFVVGCDGAHSMVRHTLGLGFSGGEYPEDFLVAHAGIDWELPPDRIGMLLSRDGSLFGNPLPDGRWILTGELAEGEARDDDPRLEDLQRLLDRRAPEGSRARDIVWASFFRMHHRQVSSYGQAPMFVAGDAAHIHSPAGGQGMNTGIQDAFNLGWKLGMVTQNRAEPGLLDSYDAERRPVGKEAIRFAHQLQVSSSLHHPVLQRLRNTVLKVAGQLEVVRHLTLDQMSETAYSYRRGPLAAEHCDVGFHLHRDARHAAFEDCLSFHHGPSAGDRAPDVALGDQRLHFYLRRAEFVALLFEGTHRPLRDERDLLDLARAMAEAWAGLVHVCVVTPFPTAPPQAGGRFEVIPDPFQAAHRRYGARGPCLYLLRPDGYILYRAQPADPLRAARFAREVGLDLPLPELS